MLQRWAPSNGKHCVPVVFSLMSSSPNELNFTQLISVTFTTVRHVARMLQQGGAKITMGDIFFEYNIECMQQPPRKKSLVTCKLYSH